jgi:hypothetical protein
MENFMISCFFIPNIPWPDKTTSFVHRAHLPAHPSDAALTPQPREQGESRVSVAWFTPLLTLFSQTEEIRRSPSSFRCCSVMNTVIG